MRIVMVLFLSLIISSVQAADFTINTTYWFTKIKAVCSDGSCSVYVNDKYKDNYDYQLDNNIAYTNINGMNIKYNIKTKELSY